MIITHEQYLAAVRDVVIKEADITGEEKTALENVKLVYGHRHGRYGFTCYDSWENKDGKHAVIQLCLNAEESLLQLATTTIHELGHVIAGHAAGHGPEWKAACRRLGFPGARAVGFNPHDPLSLNIQQAILKIPEPTDGKPNKDFDEAVTTAGPCGQGTRGGKSRGKGSGSRLKKIECPKCGYAARTTKKWLEVGLPTCPCGMKMIDS